MSADVIVQKYAQSLFEACEASKATDVVAAQLQTVSQLFAAQDVQAFFSGPLNSSDNRVMVAKSALEGKCAPELFNFMIMLVNNGRMGLVAEINNAFQGLVRSKSGETEGVLYVAQPATDAFKAQVEAKLSKSLNKKVKLSVQTDASLISGYKVTVGGWTLDDSAQYHLNKIKDEISKRGL